MDNYRINCVWIERLIVALILTIIVGCTPPVDESERKIIQEIVDVQISILESQPQQLEINASGIVSSRGWSSPALVPSQYIVPPEDGIYDFTFYATPPEESGATVITPIEATHRLDPLPDDLKGVRIYSETNNIVVMLEVQKPPAVPTEINEITDVQLSLSDTQSAQLEISAQGTVLSAGWSQPTLIAFEYVVAPQDGIYDFTFYATPPIEPGATVITSIEVKHRLNTLPDNLKGVRIHSSTNNIVVMLEVQKPPPVPTIINEITDVQLSLSDAQLAQLEISAQGTVLSAGWSKPTLIAFEYVVAPQDGIYDFTFYATPPIESGAAVITPIDVRHRLNALPDNLKGVRIHSSTNNIVVMLEVQKPPPVPTIINEITDVQLSLLESLPPQLVINAKGTVDSAGWSRPILVVHEYLAPPEDGIYEFTYYATPPAVPGATIITATELTHVLDPMPDGLLGVRIYSATNNIEARLIIEQPAPEIINEITDVQLSILEGDPRQLDITVTGNVTSAGWSSPILVPVQYIVAPQDGIYDFTFYATPPVEPGVMVLTPIEIRHRLNPLIDNVKGIRIHSETNEQVVMLSTQIPPVVPRIILEVTDVQLSTPAGSPGQLDISVSGMVGSGGWSQPMLIAHEYLVPPADGIYDFTFYATPPSGAGVAVVLSIAVVHRLYQVPADLTGVRVHSIINNIAVLLNDSDQLALNNSMQLWRDSGVTTYQYTYQSFCFCPPVENLIITVNSGMVTEATYTPSGTPSSVQDLNSVFTIEALFSTIQEAINSEVSTVDVIYNADIGYPERISIDWDVRSVDDEITYVVTDFQ